MALVKTAEEIKKYITVDGSFDFNTVMPYIELAEDEVKRVLGKEQYTELDDYYNGTNNGIPELDDLLPYAQRPVVYFAFYKGFDKFNVSITNNGIGVVHNTQLAPASAERVKNLRTSMSDTAWDSLEYLLQFLEENSDDYSAWESSDAYKDTYDLLITSARKFDEIYTINRSRLNYLNWKPTMKDIEELEIAPAISPEMVTELKTQQKDGTLTAPNKKVLADVQKALAYYTAAKNGDEAVAHTAQLFLMKAKKTMDTGPDNYPTYKASTVYLETTRVYTPYENDPKSNIAAFG